jgi:spermidine synthase
LSYYEINPAVLKLAREHFTYLERCTEKTTVALGDGRLLLEQEVAAGGEPYDVIMVDAFTDDSIPAHLLTTEAFTEAYQPLLQEGGVIAFHISNRFLNLAPPIVGLARSNGYEAVIQIGEDDPEDPLVHATNWVLVAKPAQVERLQAFAGVYPYSGTEFVWSDERSSILSVLSLYGSRPAVVASDMAPGR